METTKRTLKVTQEWVNRIEALQYEVHARRELLTHMIDSGADTKSDNFKHYHEEYLAFYKKFEDAKEEFAREYIYPNTGNMRVNWNLDFKTQEVTF